MYAIKRIEIINYSINYVVIRSKIMNSALFNSILIVSIFSTTDITSAQNNNCNACNCRFNNVQVLKELIRAEITTLQRNETSEPRKFLSPTTLQHSL